MLTLVVGLALFLGVHSVSIFIPGWRDAMAERMGALKWKGIYSLASLAGFVLLVHGYGEARAAPVLLYQPTPWMSHLSMLLMLPVFPLLMAAYLPGRISTAVRHPMLAATKVWAVAHLLANGTLADALLFGSFLAWAVADRVSVDRRPKRAIPGAPRGRFNDSIAIIGGLVLYGLFVLGLHGWLTGIPLRP
jgi:uncharacterized membrane protein